MTDIGRAGMVMKGDYNSAANYETLDVVSYNNGLYVAKQSVPAGTVPTNTTYWQLAIDSQGLQPKNLDTPLNIGGSSKTTVEGALSALNNVWYSNPNWAYAHSFPISKKPAIGLAITSNNTALYIVVNYDSGSIYLAKVFGDNTITASVEGGQNVFTLAFLGGLTVIMSTNA